MGSTFVVNVADVDAALLAKLGADATLMAYLPDGVWRDMAPAPATRFCIVQTVLHADVEAFKAPLFEVYHYRVTARALQTTGVDVNGAAFRIHALLQDADLGPIPGAVHMQTLRVDRVGPYVEVDAFDRDVRWQVAGAEYEIHISPV